MRILVLRLASLVIYQVQVRPIYFKLQVNPTGAGPGVIGGAYLTTPRSAVH
jgi:hypothetical protein